MRLFVCLIELLFVLPSAAEAFNHREAVSSVSQKLSPQTNCDADDDHLSGLTSETRYIMQDATLLYYSQVLHFNVCSLCLRHI